MPYRPDPEGHEVSAIRAVADIDRARILEVGCGDGRLLFRYAGVASFVVGCEPGGTTLSISKRVCPAPICRRVKFVQSRAEALPFRDRSFEIALFASSL